MTDPTNADRAERAAVAVAAYAEGHYHGLSEEDDETKVLDLLCDLLHLARSLDLEPHNLLDRARGLFEGEELDEEGAHE